MSATAAMPSGSNDQVQWNLTFLSEDTHACAADPCPRDTFVDCDVCCERNRNSRAFGVVLSMKPFYVGNFKEHVKSVCCKVVKNSL